MSNYEIFVYGWIAIGFISFPFILRYDAPYGRHTSSNWGPLVDNRIGWIVMELPALIVCPLIVFLSNNPISDITTFFIILWVMHYFNRSIIFPLRIKTKKKKMPLLIAFLAFLFNVINGMVNGIFFGNIKFDYSTSWLSSPEFILGIILFITGFIINNKSDSYLISLRKDKDNGYVIPNRVYLNMSLVQTFLER